MHTADLKEQIFKVSICTKTDDYEIPYSLDYKFRLALIDHRISL